MIRAVNTLAIVRPPSRVTPSIQAAWNRELVRNLHDLLGQLSQQMKEEAAEIRRRVRAGTDTIADAATTVAVTFNTARADANYAVGVSTDGDEFVWVTSIATTGFTLNRTASFGARAVDWTATPHEDT